MKGPFVGWRLSGVVAVLALSAAPATLGQELYLAGRNEPVLTRIDGPTGQVLSEVPVIGIDSFMRGLAVRWDGMLFAPARMEEGPDGLVKIDPQTGEAVWVGVLPQGLFTLAADPNTGQLYGTTDTRALYRINHLTGAGTFVGYASAPEMFVHPMAMAIAPDGTGYLTDWGTVGLFRVDLATAKTTFVCYLGSMNYYEDMAFDESGLLWGAFAVDESVRRVDVGACQQDWLYDGWAVNGLEVVPDRTGCFADCNADGELNFFDFLCFQNAFDAGDPRAECVEDGVFDFFDFLCFLNTFDAGC
jgi:hypothetical protein